MCDTIVATPRTTRRGVTLFGKNSDRQRNEAQAVEWITRIQHPANSVASCTYISIPQVSQTHALLLCRPFWIWGAEMGANEHGVVIGNEGLHARLPAPQESALLGMDLLRLGLERAATAEEAVTVMTTLLEKYGQGGNCGHLIPDYYHNGFIVADHRDAYVLETVGREWLAEKVSSVRSLSNIYSIHTPTSRSTGLQDLIATWSDVRLDTDANHADLIRNPTSEHVAHAGPRAARAQSLLALSTGDLSVEHFTEILRDHTTDPQTGRWHPARGTKRTICTHATTFPAQTVGSLVSELSVGRAVHWVTGTSAPCLSIFKPVFVDLPLPNEGLAAGGSYDAATLWWRHEKMHRQLLSGELSTFISAIKPRRDALEADFRRRIEQVRNSSVRDERLRVIQQCWREAAAVEADWEIVFREMSADVDQKYLTTWADLSKTAGMPL